ncbi:MAG: transporter [bacterium]|nr:transporter [bacterium]
MSDLEYDVLDELYFVVSFDDLMEKTDLEDHELKKVLNKLLQKSWIKCLSSATDDVPEDDLNFDRDARRYFYLATKAGLMAHNSNG